MFLMNFSIISSTNLGEVRNLIIVKHVIHYINIFFPRLIDSAGFCGFEFMKKFQINNLSLLNKKPLNAHATLPMFRCCLELYATIVFWIWISVAPDSLDFETFMVVGWRFEVEDGRKSGRLRGMAGYAGWPVTREVTLLLYYTSSINLPLFTESCFFICL